MTETERTIKPVKVTHLITGLHVGGAEMMLYKLLSKFDRDRVDCSVISLTEGGEMAARIRALNIPVSSLGMKGGVSALAGIWKLVQLLRTARPDVVQTWLYHADLLGLIGAKLARVPGIAWNLRCSNMGEAYYRGISGFVVKTLARLSGWPDVVVVNSEAGKRLHTSFGYSPRKWQVIFNGFELDKFHPDPSTRAQTRRALGYGEDDIVIGMVARFDPVKGHSVFLDAAQRMIASCPAARFVLVGTGYEPDNADLVGGLSDELRRVVNFLGRRNDVPAVMASLDIFTNASFGEGFPNVVGEAMACEVPCVVTDVGDCATIVADTGRVVPPANPDKMVAAWQELIALGRNGRTELGVRARARIVENFDLMSIVRTYERLYSSRVLRGPLV